MRSRNFLPRQSSRGKNVFGGLIALLVVVGFILQYQWMKRARQEGAAGIAPNTLAEKISQWMLEKKAPEAESAVREADGTEKIFCEACLGTGSVLSGGDPEEICPICQGVGYRMIRRFDPADRICPNCVGMGRSADPDTGAVGTCPRCDGRGLIRSRVPADAAPGVN